jgi:Protein kinase domain/Bacterial Ig-like domain (group 2)
VVDSGFPPLAEAVFAEGAEVAGYRLEEQLGRGGMAVVFRALDERLNRQVALKILAPVLAADQAFRQRFIAESRTAAAVEDPNIIPVYEAGESGGVLFIAMRLVRGGDLKTMVARYGPLATARAGRIVSAVASALDSAHAAGLVHRDVKPANMLLDVRAGRPDHVYLSDFGVSKAALATSGLTGTGQFVGTVDYAAPEQIQDRAVDGRTDQYALGCSAFELLCGRPPFSGREWIAGMYAHVSEPPPPPSSLRSELPAAVDAVLARVLAKSPDDRYGSCLEFAAALTTALEPASPVALAAAARDEATLAPAASGREGGTDPAVTAGPSVRTDRLETPAGLGGPAADATPARRRSRLLLASALGVVILLAGAAIAAFLPARAAPGPASYRFAPRVFGSGLTLGQVWTLSGADGSQLDVTISAANPTGKSLIAQLEEPVPAAVASDLDAVRFQPAAMLLPASRVAVWDLRLSAGRTASVRFEAPLPAAGATQARLQQLTRAFRALAGRQVLEPIPPGGVLQSVLISPAGLELRPGQSARLTVRGTLSNGRKASAAEMARAAWSSSNPTAAVVTARGEVTAESGGVTVVTVRVGLITTSALVTVDSPGTVEPTRPGEQISPPPGHRGGSPSPSTSPSPTVTPGGTPTPTGSATIPPSPSPSSTPGGSSSPSPTPAGTDTAASRR